MTRDNDSEFGDEDTGSSELSDGDGARLQSAEVVPFPRADESRNIHPVTSSPAEPGKNQAIVAHAVQQVLRFAESSVRHSETSLLQETSKDAPHHQAEERNASGTAATGKPDVPAVATGGGGGDPPQRGGGGGGGGGSPPLHKRSSDSEFRDVLGKGLSNARRNLVTVGIFSVAVNLLVLAIPVYLFNMSDRVMTSRSTDTLVMLSMIVVVAKPPSAGMGSGPGSKRSLSRRL